MALRSLRDILRDTYPADDPRVAHATRLVEQAIQSERLEDVAAIDEWCTREEKLKAAYRGPPG